MTSQADIPELRRPMTVDGLADDMRNQLVDDVTEIMQRVPFVEIAPARLWDAGLVSELGDVVARLSEKFAKLQEAQGADR